MVDRNVSRIRRWLEDRLPWYDREAEQRKERDVELHRQQAIEARVHLEDVHGQTRWGSRLHAYRRVRTRD